MRWPFKRKTLVDFSTGALLGELSGRGTREVLTGIFAAIRAGDLQRISDDHIASLHESLCTEQKNRAAWKLIEDYLNDPEESGVAGSEIAANAELINEQNRCEDFVERYNSAGMLEPLTSQRTISEAEYFAHVIADVPPGRLTANLPGCGSVDQPLMQPGEFRRLKLASTERPSAPVSPDPLPAKTDIVFEPFDHDYYDVEPKKPRATQKSLGDIIRDNTRRNG